MTDVHHQEIVKSPTRRADHLRMLRHRRALIAFFILVSVFGVLADPAEATPPIPTDGVTESVTTHVVRAGEHLLAIARKHSVLLTDLLTLNGLTIDSVIQPGDVLTLPLSTRPPTPAAGGAPAVAPASGVPAATTYTVRPGDYLVGIAARHGVTLSALLRSNNLDVASTIVPGRVLAIPAATLPIASPAAATPAPPATTPAPAPATPQAPQVATPATTDPAGPFQVLRAFLEAQIGKPYKFNTAGPDTYDCSGLVVAAFAQLGIRLPHQSLLLSKVGTDVDLQSSGIAPGDLIFVYSSATPGQIGHVGIALTSSTWIQAVGTGIPVRVRAIPTADKIRAVRRVL